MERCLFATSLLFALGMNAFAQPPEAGQAFIVAGIIESKRLTVTSADIAKLPKKTVQVKTEKGVSTFEGVTLQSVLEMAGVLFGPKLQGARLMAFVVVEGAPPSPEDFYIKGRTWGDDYRALFSLPELDGSYTKQPVVLATTQDGKPIAAPEGRFLSSARQRRAS